MKKYLTALFASQVHKLIHGAHILHQSSVLPTSQSCRPRTRRWSQCTDFRARLPSWCKPLSLKWIRFFHINTHSLISYRWQKDGAAVCQGPGSRSGRPCPARRCQTSGRGWQPLGCCPRRCRWGCWPMRREYYLFQVIEYYEYHLSYRSLRFQSSEASLRSVSWIMSSTPVLPRSWRIRTCNRLCI